MKNFMRWMQHFWLLNLCIIRYCIKFLFAFAKGERFFPQQSTDTNLSNLKSDTGMGIYEYDCCVRYAKKIRKELFAQDLDSLEVELILPEEATMYNGYLPVDLGVFRKCISKVAEETGFRVTKQETLSYKVSYLFRMRSVI